ncbi:MAG: WD40 repeat protein [Gammaproteobacteria bacterium]|jgi:WD40 repeat protein
MKKKYIVLLMLTIGIISWSYYQLFDEPEIIDADYITLDKVFVAHSDEVWSVKFSPNDSLLVSAGYEENVKIWSRDNGKVIHDLKHPYLATGEQKAEVLDKNII